MAHLTLHRPESYNAINLPLAQELADAALQCAMDVTVRSVLLRGDGNTFCAGGDLKDFSQHASDLSLYLHEVTTALHTAISRFTHMDAPVIAAVHGTAAGAGMSLACACDLVVATESSKFTMAYTRAGLSPDGSATYFLPRIVGLGRALELILSNRVLDGREAMDWGIVNMVVEDNDLEHRAQELAVTLASGPTQAFGAAKRLARTGWTEELETQMAAETRSIGRLAMTHDGQEGIAAFIEKRDATFEGR